MTAMNFANRTLISFATFNAGWWICALGPSSQMEWIAPASMPLWIGLHLYFTPVKKGEALFLGAMGALGFVFDTLLIQAGLFEILPKTSVTPSWLVCMWILLGITFESMLLVRRRLLFVCLAGVMSGPFSYLFAQAVNILTYGDPQWLTLSIHGLIWAGLMPVLFKLRDFIVGATVHHSPVHSVPAETRVVDPLSLPEQPASPQHPKVSQGKR